MSYGPSQEQKVQLLCIITCDNHHLLFGQSHRRHHRPPNEKCTTNKWLAPRPIKQQTAITRGLRNVETLSFGIWFWSHLLLLLMVTWNRIRRNKRTHHWDHISSGGLWLDLRTVPAPGLLWSDRAPPRRSSRGRHPWWWCHEASCSVKEERRGLIISRFIYRKKNLMDKGTIFDRFLFFCKAVIASKWQPPTSIGAL